MSDLYEAYASEIHRQLDFSATWPSGAHISLGDLVQEDDGVYHREGALPATVAFATHADPHPDEDFTFQSRRGVDIHFKIAGEAPSAAFQSLGTAEAGASIEFSETNAVVFAMHDVRVEQVDDLRQLKSDLLELVKTGRLHRDNAVVVELVTAGSGTVLASTSAQAKVEIRAEADIGQITDLGAVEAGLSLARYKDVGVKIVSRRALTPLFRAVRIRRSVWDKIFGREGEFEFAFQRPELDVDDVDAYFEPISAYKAMDLVTK